MVADGGFLLLSESAKSLVVVGEGGRFSCGGRRRW